MRNAPSPRLSSWLLRLAVTLLGLALGARLVYDLLAPLVPLLAVLLVLGAAVLLILRPRP